MAETTVFQQAFLEWRDSVLQKKKSHKSRFLLSCNQAIVESNGSISPEAILDGITSIESKKAQKFGNRTTKKILGPVVNVLKDYYGVIDTCCQADPFPTAVIWGSLKVIIDGLGRYFELFDKIRSQLHMLKFQLERLKWFDDLWGESDDMQRYLCATYVHVFRFWSAVDKECDRMGISSLMRATTSFSTKKIQGVIDDLSMEMDRVESLGQIEEARIQRGERELSAADRKLAGLEIIENRKARKFAAKFMDTVLVENEVVKQERFYSETSRWLGSRATNKTNVKRHHDNIDNRFGDTCEWILKTSWYQDWLKGDSNDPILWLHAQPGSGKSTICSHAMAHIESLQDSPAVAFQFFHFDEQTTARQLLYNIAAQLFDQYWRRNKTVPENLRVSLTDASDDFKNIELLIHSLLSELPQVFIFLDGLDEEDTGARQKEALKILDFVIGLTKQFPERVKFWLSTQDRAIFRNRLQDSTTIDIQGEIKTAVHRYLCQAIPGLCDLALDEGTQRWALRELQERADGHFLWATLMIKEITGSIPSISHLKSFISDGLPLDLNGYYERILGRYHSDPEKEYAAKILSIVVFARRRLTVNELIEAIWITSDDIDHQTDTIFINFVKKLFLPLVVIDYDEKDADNDLCRLYHSTARTYLMSHPDILQNSVPHDHHSKLLISEDVLASACLAYLGQRKYSALLQNTSSEDEKWTTNGGEDIEDHHLLLYSSKYWDKHLDNVKETTELRRSVEQFLKSPNFVTTLQLQSLFVETHFGVYTLRNVSSRYKFLKRVFPQWFSSRELLKSGKLGSQSVKHYRNFVSEWRHFLHRPTCFATCRRKPHAGEVDRCLWGALGPHSFLANNKSRYESFMLANEKAPKDRFSRKKNKICVDGFAEDGRTLAVVHFPSKAATSKLGFQLENWTLSSGSSPYLETEECISFERESCHWPLYSTVTYGNRTMLPIKFTPNLSCLRIGSQLLFRQQNGKYTKIMGHDAAHQTIPWYFDDFAVRGNYVVLVSRQKAPNATTQEVSAAKEGELEKNAPDDDADSEESDLPSDPSASYKASSVSTKKSSNGRKVASEKDSSDSDESSKSPDTDSDPESETHDVLSESSSISLELDSAEEDWSDGSTDLEDLGFPPSDDGGEETPTESEESSTSESSSSSETDEEHPTGNRGFLVFDDSDSGKDVDLEDDDGDGDCGYRSDSDGPTFKRITKSKTPKGTITVFDISKEPPQQLFQYMHPLPVILYDSPPIIHPTKSLVVWPLCGGDILFADFVSKSYFIRKSSPTSRRTRHVFMKVHFSSDGAYLHLASLEAQELPQPKRSKSGVNKQDTKKKEEKKKPPLQLSLYVTTHRLSQSKTTRSPPNQIHHTKLSLGTFSSISVAQMPISLKWTPAHVYCTISSSLLRVFRIELFKPKSLIPPLTIPSDPAADSVQPTTNINITVPKSQILLPDSSRVREIHFYPPSSIDKPGTILIGSLNPTEHRRIKQILGDEDSHDPDKFEELPDVTSPPIGLFVKEGDLGEWISEEGREAELKWMRGRAAGLRRKVESFDAEDDCDIEVYIS